MPFDVREGELQFALRDFGDQRLLLRRRSGPPEQAAAEDHRGEIGFEHEAATEGLHHDHRIDRAAAKAAVLFLERQTEQTKFGILLPGVAAPAVRLRLVFLALLELVLIGDQPVNTVLEQTLFVGQVEVHFSPRR